MPNYFHHLKFELYPYPERSSDHIYGKKSHIPAITASTRNADSAARELWLPEQGVDIFDSARWPRHRPVNESAAKGPAGLEKAETAQPAHGRGSRGGHSISRGGGFELEPRRSDYDTVNHDARGTLPQRGDTGQQVSNAKANSSDFEIARRDWRFGRVRVESWETTLNFTTGTEEGNMNRPGLAHRRGESSAALTTIGGEEIQRSGINAGLAAGGVGKVTKSRFEEGKNTEVGWGIVHLYRDGEESVSHGGHKEIEVYGSGLGSRGSEDGRLADEAVGEGERRDEEDYTTLCIPAVPSYLTPSDFLGFVGEKTREEVSHFRMVMTGRMNRYLVLMKFRDGAVAKRWKAEWDGKVFNSMEVSRFSCTFK